MGTIRKQSLLSTGVIIIGFLIGFVNTLLFTRNNSFTGEEYALTRVMWDIVQIFVAIGMMSVPPVLYKFFPYYKDNLNPKENDLLTWCLVAGFIGFVLLLVGGIIAEPLMIRKFSVKSMLLVKYYFWIFPFTFFFLFFNILEAYSWQLRKTVFPNFLKETTVRLLTTVLILLKVANIISYDIFIKLFACIYGFVLLILVVYLVRSGHFNITFKVSRVSRKFSRKIFILFGLTYTGQIINTLAQTLDSIFLAGIVSLASAAPYIFATYIITFAVIPQRAMINISIPVLSQAWKDKNIKEIDRIYKRSAINLLAGGIFIILNLWEGLYDAIVWLNLNEEYQTIMPVVYILGVAKLLDLGTGLNNFIIGTSSYWRFEFFCGVILLAISIPTNYFLISHFGMIGAAISALFVVIIYNTIRVYFLWKKFKLSPFVPETLKLLLLSAVAFLIAYLPFQSLTGFMGALVRCGLFSTLFIVGMYFGKISPDVDQMIEKVMARYRKR